ncbi:MAG: hypothetical protein ABI334_09800 [Candidatus Dormiibacterota bacterium]
MQATRTFGGPGISRSLVSVVVAMSAAFVLGAGGGYAARSLNVAAPATSAHVGTVSALRQQAPDAAERNANLSVRIGGPGGQIGDLAAGNDSNALVSAPTRAVVPAIDPAAGYDISKFVVPQFDPAAWYDLNSVARTQLNSNSSDDNCIDIINHHKAC